MFKHQGKSRTYRHNLKIASILSLVAGIVNVTGFLAILQLTTHVTGHFALMMYDVHNFEFEKAAVFLFYINSFLLGSFTSGLLIQFFKENKRLNVYVIPIMIEALILIGVAIVGDFLKIDYPNVIACILLFAMGLQNSYVTKISDAIVRTTHLTGLFTDLGIELSQLFFPKSHPHISEIRSRIKMRIYIITFFFIGGVIGNIFYSNFELKLKTLSIAAAILIVSLFYDDMLFKIRKARRKIKKFRKKALRSI
ncbi:MAG: YoaK family protein [Psychroflexus sp.]|uniref:YoaK family protein n=1 Tax=Psychroflexus sp. S27 TaxID=1982757 RepID=UPI000C29EAA8|nr:YoaK family protein [Psychroflexus sp. S27]PJX20038.1 hypothetical protein CAP47_12075 [Psychroflexus sp. S27]